MAKILVGMPLPANYSAMLRDIEKSQQQYDNLRKQRRRLRRAYLGYLLVPHRRRAVRFVMAGLVPVENGDPAAGRFG